MGLIAAVDKLLEDPGRGTDGDREGACPGGGLGGGDALAEALVRDRTGMCVRFLRLARFCLARDCYSRDGALGAHEIF